MSMRVLRQVRQDSPDRAIAFAAGQRNLHLLLDALERLDVSRHGGLFEKQDLVRLNRRGELNQRGRRHGAMGVEHDRAVLARRAAGPAAPPRPSSRCRPGRPIAASAELPILTALAGRIDANLVARRAAEQPIDGHAPQLAGDVPQRHVDAGNRVHHEGAAALVALRAVERLPQVLDPRRILPVEQLEHRLRQRLRHRRHDALDLAPAADAVIGAQLDEHAIAADRRAEAGEANRRGAVGDGGGRYCRQRTPGRLNSAAPAAQPRPSSWRRAKE